MQNFIPLTDELIYERPQQIDGPVVPYQVDYQLELPEVTNAGWSQENSNINQIGESHGA